jgi:hypothetical protein
MIIATISATCVIIDKNDDRMFGFHEEKYIAVFYEYTLAEAVFLNFYGAQKSIPRKRFRQPM